MISLQILSRNLWRVALLRGFASAPVVTKKPSPDEKKSKIKKDNEQVSTISKIDLMFEKLLPKL